LTLQFTDAFTVFDNILCIRSTKKLSMLAKTVILILLLAMVISLGAAMFSMMRDKGRGTGTVKALTYRVAIWDFLLLLIVGGLYTGLLKPGGSLQQAAISTQQ
jgi:hypothetical protein